jgi:hypothetical protein
MTATSGRERVMGSYNGGGTFCVGADFGACDPDSCSPSGWRSKYQKEFSDGRFEKNLPALLSARRLDLQALAANDASYLDELKLVELFLSDPQHMLPMQRPMSSGHTSQLPDAFIP